MVDVFPKPVRLKATRVGFLTVRLVDQPVQAGQPATQTADFQMELLDDAGNEVRTLQDNLAPHLTTAQLNGLKALLTALRTKAVEALD